MKCPHCHQTIPDTEALRQIGQETGSRSSGNRTTGEAKREAQRKSVEARRAKKRPTE